MISDLKDDQHNIPRGTAATVRWTDSRPIEGEEGQELTSMMTTEMGDQ